MKIGRKMLPGVTKKHTIFHVLFKIYRDGLRSCKTTILKHHILAQNY